MQVRVETNLGQLYSINCLQSIGALIEALQHLHCEAIISDQILQCKLQFPMLVLTRMDACVKRPAHICKRDLRYPLFLHPSLVLSDCAQRKMVVRAG